MGTDDFVDINGFVAMYAGADSPLSPRLACLRLVGPPMAEPVTSDEAAAESRPPRMVEVVTATGLDLAVPPAETEAAQSRGAVWDEGRACWRVPPGRTVNVFRFRRWLPGDVVVDEGPSVSAAVVSFPQPCWFCGAATRVIAGVLVPPRLALDPEGFVAFDDVAEHLAEVLDEAELASLGVGPLRWRKSRAVPRGYVANTCSTCRRLQGSWHVTEALGELLFDGVGYDRLITGLAAPIPEMLLTLAIEF